MFSEFFFVHRTNINTIDEDFAALELIEPAEKTDDAFFACSGMPDNSHRFARVNLERNIFENPILVIVGKPYITKLERAFNCRQRCWSQWVGNESFIIQQFEDPFRRRHCCLHDIIFFREVPYRPPEHFVELQKRHDSTDRKSTRLNSSHGYISYAVFCLKH